MSTNKPSAWGDACCRPTYGSSLRDADGLTTEDVQMLLKYNVVGIVTLQFIQLTLLWLWQLCSLVPGFARFDGPAGQVSAVTHTGWWLALEWTTLFIGGAAVYFGLHYSRSGRIEKGVARTRLHLRLYRVLLVIAMVANVVHIVLSAVELNSCSSTLCTMRRGFLIALIALLVVLALLEGWLFYRVWTYDSNIGFALGTELSVWDVPSSVDGSADPESDINGSIAPLQAPLLAQAQESLRQSVPVHRLRDRRWDK